jgi:hypothetical protein
MATVIISRSKIYPTPGRNYRVAWKWNYTVRTEDGQEFSGDMLGWAKRLAREKAGPTGDVRLEWEMR